MASSSKSWDDGVIDISQNPFAWKKDWIRQGHSFTVNRQRQAQTLLYKTYEEIRAIDKQRDPNYGSYPAFVAIRWRYAEMRDNRLVPTAKWTLEHCEKPSSSAAATQVLGAGSRIPSLLWSQAMTTEISFEQFKSEWMQSIQADNPSTVQLGNRFAHKLITQWLDENPDTDDIVYCDGSGDGGIDAAYLSRKEAADNDADVQTAGDSWYLIQSKYGAAFRGTKTLIEESQKVIDTLDGKRTRLSSLAEGVLR